MGSTSCKICSFTWMSSRISSVANPITIHIMISSKFFFHFFQSLKVQYLSSIKLSGIIPLQFIDNPIVHPHIKICNNKNRSLQPICKIKGHCRKFKAFFWIFWKKHYMFSITMRSISTS